MGFSIDAVEDLRLAVSEACNELFAAAVVTPITVELRPDGGTLEVAISATIPESSDRSSSESTLSWLVLEALTEHPSREVIGDRFVIRFSQTVVHER